MKEEMEKPEQFAVAIRSGVAHVERNLSFGADTIRINVEVKMVKGITVTDLHCLSIESAIGHLKTLLPKTDATQA